MDEDNVWQGWGTNLTKPCQPLPIEPEEQQSTFPFFFPLPAPSPGGELIVLSVAKVVVGSQGTFLY